MRPLGRAAYGSIPHLPGSRTGPGDRHVDAASARRCLTGRPGESVLIEEKLDGSCVAVARVESAIVALGRAGDLAAASDNEARRMFAHWVAREAGRFERVLAAGEWLAGEWLALAHGTRYRLAHEPFVAFDLLRAGPREALRAPRAELEERAARAGLTLPAVVHRGPLDSAAALAALGAGWHGALDPPEGVVYRIERAGRVTLVAKFVRQGKIDGAYLPENTGQSAVWNWRSSEP